MINVLYLSYNKNTPSSGYWDMAMLDDIFNNRFAKVGKSYTYQQQDVSSIPYILDFAVIILPARSQAGYIDKFNEQLKRLKSVLIFIVGDEEGVFPVEKITHPKAIIYVMSAISGLDTQKYKPFPNGYPPQIREFKKSYKNRDINFFFSGQITHERRYAFLKELNKRNDGVLIPTEGFTQGMPHDEYYEIMQRTIVAPCPSGPETPDTFRLYEALHMGCIPIADYKTPSGKSTEDYWTQLFNGEPPFPIIHEDSQINGYIDDMLKNHIAISNKILAWWINYKRNLTLQIINDISTLSDIPPDQESITVLISASPIKSNPSIKIIKETIDSIRHHLPNSEIMIMFDGVRKEQENLRKNYDLAINKILHLANTEYQGIVPVLFNEHSHQAKMTRETLGLINTNQLLFVEHDTPLCTDVGIDFPLLSSYIDDGISNMVRFHFEAKVPKEHKHMTHGIDKNSEYLLRTSQWSQRPHLASKYFYITILHNYFTKNAVCFIESKMHSVLAQAYIEGGMDGWNQFRVHIYTPEENIKRSYHLDGRGDDISYESANIY